MSIERLSRSDMGQFNLPTYIVIEGPIGVGKTTLSHLLSETLNAGLILEAPEANPFLPQFYEGEQNAALATQLHFLLQRSQQIQQLQQNDLFHTVQIADFLIDKDAMFAELTLSPEEFKLYRQVSQHLSIDAPKPDLVIYLQAPKDILLNRIKERADEFERHISAEYLTQVSEAYSRFFHFYQDSPLLIVNTQDLDWINRPEDYNDLVRYMLDIRSGRHYYNPHAKI